MVRCRPGIVGVDDERDGCMASEGTALQSKTAKTHEAPVKNCCVYAKIEARRNILGERERPYW